MPNAPLKVADLPVPATPARSAADAAEGAGGGAGSAAGAGAGAGAGGGAAGGSGAAASGPEAMFTLQGFQPDFVRPPPPLLDFDEQELMWLTPMEATPLLWDDGMCQDAASGSAVVRALVLKATTGALQAAQQKVSSTHARWPPPARRVSRALTPARFHSTALTAQQVLAELKADPKLVYHCGLTPANLPALVENNPMIAIECLLKLMPSPQISEYVCCLCWHAAPQDSDTAKVTSITVQ